MASPMDDRELIQRYAQAQDHQAFAELVRRHGDWIHSSARRQVGDPHLAKDVAQAVFLLLSRRARTLGSYAYLSGWLFNTLRYCAQAAIRQRRRRQHHERQAAIMTSTQPPAQPDWSELSPLLDQAIARLKTADREAVLLRFYEQKPLAEVGRLLGITEEAARKRVDRAVDKLRQNLAAHGVKAQTLSLSPLILAHAMEPGPTGLPERILSGLDQGSGPAGAVAKGASQLMVFAKVKVAAAIGFLVILAGAAGLTTLPSSEQPLPDELSMPALPSAVAVTGAQRETLLQDLQRLRAATRAAIVSGRGIAHLETSEERASQLGAPNPSLAPHEVRFAFRGNDSLVTGGVAFNATALLVTDARVVRYYAGAPGRPAPPGVSIYRPEPILFSTALPRWSYQEISRLPLVFSRDGIEEPSFAFMAKTPEVRVERSGSIVRVTIEPRKQATASRDLCIVEFDLEHGGMLTRYHYEGTSTHDGNKDDQREDWQLSWTNRDGIVVPSRRVAVHEVRSSGKLRQRNINRITFDAFTAETVPADQITMDQMGIPSGTPVTDWVGSNRDWRYSPGADH